MHAPAPYSAETNGILVQVTPAFLTSESSPEDDRFVWAYTVIIINRSGQTVQLMTRHWRITDCEGREQRVDGDGVVGEQPVLSPGQRFEYTSGCPLSAPSGVMRGRYRFLTQSGEWLEAEIPMFALDSPFDRRSPN